MDSLRPGAACIANAGLCIIAAIMLVAVGCQDSRGPVSVSSDDPDLQILAMKYDADHSDKRDIPTLVKDLNSDDAAIRFYSIGTLHQLTHDDFGYHYYDDEDQRAPAVARWQNWLKAK